MRKHAMAACLLMATLGVCAQTHEKDSLRVISLQEVEIISTRATGTTPVVIYSVSTDNERCRCRYRLHEYPGTRNRCYTHQRNH